MMGGILQTATLFSGGFQGVLNSLESAGFFSYALPFLLIFALVFGVLTRMQLFKENKAITAIIALAVGLMSLQFNLVPQFFAKIFPSFSIGLIIILVILILIGLFTDPNKPWIMYTLLAIAAIIAVVVVVSSSGLDLGAWIQNNLGDAAGTIIVLVLVVIGLAAAMGLGKKRGPGVPGNAKDYNPYLLRIPTE
jgi:hypothetical protein